MADEDETKPWDWGLTVRRIVSAVVIVLVVPTLIRKCAHEDALQRVTADSSRTLGDHEQAIALYTGLIARDPNNAALYAGRGDSYRIRRSRPWR